MRHLFIRKKSYGVLFLLFAFLMVEALQSGGAGSFAQVFKPGVAKAAGLNAIQAENSLPGDSSWNDFSTSLTPDLISGYGSKISVNHGDSLDFFVTTTAANFSIDIYRTGWYGGLGARKITTLGTFPGVHQAIPTPDPITGMVACSWTKTTTLAIPTTWVSGIYLARLTASTGDKSFIFFVVRNDGGHEALLFQSSVTTYEAYNNWGGTSLYNNNTDKSIFSGAHATKVSFDRPFNPGDSNGAGHYLFFEVKFVYWMESQGYDVAYTTDVDTDSNASTLSNHKGFLSVGHDEYWSKGMRDTVQQAINVGVNVAFFGANEMYWQIRFEPNAAGNPRRVEVGYKDFATSTTAPGPDPMWHVNDSIVTSYWREAPVNLPENAVVGAMYENQVNQSFPFVVQNAANWVYAGTGFTDGSSVPGIVGYEYDKVFNNGLSPAGLTILGNSPVINVLNANTTSNATLYTARSGANVFAAGTIEWSWGLANIQGNTAANAGIQRATANILDNFSNSQLVQPPVVRLNATSLSFGNQSVNVASTTQKVTLTNSGTASLVISNIAVGGTNASNYAQTNTCPATVAPAASCTITVTFTPTTAGARAANLQITDNAADSPQTLVLSGTGVIPTSVYMNDGFESGTFSAWKSGGSLGFGSLKIQNSVVNSGHNALAINNMLSLSTNLYGTLSPGPQTQTFTRLFFRYNSLVFGIVPLAYGRSANGSNSWEVDINTQRHGLDIYFWSASTMYHVFSPNNGVNANTWYSVEIQDMQVKSGRAEVWVNGSSVGSVDADLSVTSPYAALMLYNNSVGGTIYFDDVRVASAYNGTSVV